jgi:hypothetical protein
MSMCPVPDPGVGFATRQVGNRTKPNLVVTSEDGTVCLKSQSTFKTTEIKFKLNEPFEETTADDRKTTVGQGERKKTHPKCILTRAALINPFCASRRPW